MDIYRSSTHNCQNLGLMNEYIHTTEYYPVLKRNLDCRRSNQSILKEISPEYSLEGLMLKLKLQYSGHLMRRTDSSEKTLMLQRLKAGGEGDDRGWDGWMASPTQRTQVGVIGDGQGGLACCSPWDHKELDTTEQLNWTHHTSVRSPCDFGENIWDFLLTLCSIHLNLAAVRLSKGEVKILK